MKDAGCVMCSRSDSQTWRAAGQVWLQFYSWMDWGLTHYLGVLGGWGKAEAACNDQCRDVRAPTAVFLQGKKGREVWCGGYSGWYWKESSISYPIHGEEAGTWQPRGILWLGGQPPPAGNLCGPYFTQYFFILLRLRGTWGYNWVENNKSGCGLERQYSICFAYSTRGSIPSTS